MLILVGDLGDIIERRRNLRSDLNPLVFRRDNGEPVRRFYRSWKTALKRAGIPEERVFHDLRRTSVRNMTRAGVSRQVAKQISGHKTDSVFNRYDIVSEEDIREGLLKTQRHLESGHNLVTFEQRRQERNEW